MTGWMKVGALLIPVLMVLPWIAAYRLEGQYFSWWIAAMSALATLHLMATERGGALSMIATLLGVVLFGVSLF